MRERAAVQRSAVLVLVALLPACGEHKERKRAELTTPIHAVVREHTSSQREPCKETGWRSALCLVARPRVQGCLYLEVGAKVDEALPTPSTSPGAPPIDRCAALALEHDGRRVVDTAGAAASVDQWNPGLVTDSTGERLAFHSAPSQPWRIFYLVDGRLFEGSTLARGVGSLVSRLPRHDAPMPQAPSNLDDLGEPGEAPPGKTTAPPPSEPPPDWSKVPAFDEAVSDIFRKEPGPPTALFDAIKKRQGEEGLLAFSRDLDPSVPSWTQLGEALSEAGRARQTAELVERLRADGGVDKSSIFEFFLTHDVPQPKDFPELLAADVARQLGDEAPPAYGDSPPVTETTEIAEITALAKLGHPKAGEFACRSIGAAWLAQLQEGSVPYEYATVDVNLLAVLVKQKTACPWVSMALERQVCSEQLRCTADGKTLSELDQETQNAAAVADEAGTPPPVRLRTLCPVATGRRQAEASFGDDAPSPEQGPLLLAAAVANGPLPKEFVGRNARREYAVRGLPPEENPDGGEADEPPCGLTEERVSTLACTLPLEVAEVRAGGCRLVVDDAKKTVSVTGPPAPVMGSGGEGPYRRD